MNLEKSKVIFDQSIKNSKIEIDNLKTKAEKNIGNSIKIFDSKKNILKNEYFGFNKRAEERKLGLQIKQFTKIEKEK